MTTTRTHLTSADIEAGYDDARWLGWGYLGERQRMLDDFEERGHTGECEAVASADTIVLRFANELGWDAEDLFHWCNSKDGRWFGDWALGSYDTSTEPAWLPSLFPKRPAR